MVEVGKIFLVYIAGMVVCKNREVENCGSLEEGSISGDSKVRVE